ncbi:glucose-6-phosphate dehydrogenase [Microbacterium sp. P02]|uniref:glucose-6-phosphate dehydrogenase n=1 Tax=unclassified Microbacterium TaxID=2609290 RepID=UPI003671152D
MKIVSTSDWRDTIAFETPVSVADLAPGEATRCSVCGSDSEPRERDELWAVKHRHPKQHGGFVRFYCADHLPEPVAAPAPAAAPVARARTAGSRPPARTPGSSERREPSGRKPPVPDHERAVCPDCWVEVSATGECGMCGRQTA